MSCHKANEIYICKHFNCILIKLTRQTYTLIHHNTNLARDSRMELNSQYCEVSTFTSSSGYNSTASSSLNYIDEDHISSVIDTNCAQIVDDNNNRDHPEPITTKLVIIITLKKTEKVFLRTNLSSKTCYVHPFTSHFFFPFFLYLFTLESD